MSDENPIRFNTFRELADAFNRDLVARDEEARRVESVARFAPPHTQEYLARGFMIQDIRMLHAAFQGMLHLLLKAEADQAAQQQAPVDG